jgi:hypothetical protein
MNWDSEVVLVLKNVMMYRLFGTSDGLMQYIVTQEVS